MGLGAGAVLEALGLVAAVAWAAGAASACAAATAETGTGASLGVSLGAVAHPVRAEAARI